MSIAVNILYPISETSTFDAEYYFNKHMKLVDRIWGPHYQSAFSTRGDAGNAGQPPAYHAIATMVFKDQAAIDTIMSNNTEILADVANFTNVVPEILIGEFFG